MGLRWGWGLGWSRGWGGEVVRGEGVMCLFCGYCDGDECL